MEYDPNTTNTVTGRQRRRYRGRYCVGRLKPKENYVYDDGGGRLLFRETTVADYCRLSTSSGVASVSGVCVSVCVVLTSRRMSISRASCGVVSTSVCAARDGKRDSFSPGRRTNTSSKPTNPIRSPIGFCRRDAVSARDC